MKETEPRTEEVTYNVTCDDCGFLYTTGAFKNAIDARQEHLREHPSHLSVVISEVPNLL